MADKMIHQCGSSWAYCDGECKSCLETSFITTSNTYDYCMTNNANGYVYVIDNVDNLNEYGVDSNRIVEAVERTKKYLKE
jgi:hypothetical protein